MRTLSLFRFAGFLMLTAIVLLPGLYKAAAAASGGKIYFNRPASFNGAFTRPDVIIDGRKVGKLGSGECHGIRLPSGPHSIIIRDEVSLLSRLGAGINAARVNLPNGADLFITVRPLQDPENFNDAAPAYDMLVSTRGRRC